MDTKEDRGHHSTRYGCTHVRLFPSHLNTQALLECLCRSLTRNLRCLDSSPRSCVVLPANPVFSRTWLSLHTLLTVTDVIWHWRATRALVGTGGQLRHMSNTHMLRYLFPCWWRRHPWHLSPACRRSHPTPLCSVHNTNHHKYGDHLLKDRAGQSRSFCSNQCAAKDGVFLHVVWRDIWHCTDWNC